MKIEIIKTNRVKKRKVLINGVTVASVIIPKNKAFTKIILKNKQTYINTMIARGIMKEIEIIKEVLFLVQNKKVLKC